MEENNINQTTHRRGFLGMLATGAAAVGLTALVTPFGSVAQNKTAAPQGKNPAPPRPVLSPGDQWFNKIKGSHRVVFDATRPHEVMPFAWPAVFIMTNGATGTPAEDCGVVVVLRHDAIPYAFQDGMWAKYNFAELFKAGDLGGGFQAADKETATKTRNPFYNTKHGDFAVPGIGVVDIGIKDLQAKGVLFCVCNAAMTVYSAVTAEKMGMKAEDVKKEWTDNVIPGVEIVPSGVWAIGRAQEHKCAYIFAG
ncbi:MAG: twin-arginine translocation signal domain-containing protein [Bacteroidia bacterium]